MRLTLLAATCLLLGTLSGGAQQAQQAPPRFDVDALCDWQQKANQFPKFNEKTFRDCFSINQAAYERLKGIWPTAPSAIKASCMQAASYSGPASYFILEGCIRLELEKAAARQNKPDLKFRY